MATNARSAASQNASINATPAALTHLRARLERLENDAWSCIRRAQEDESLARRIERDLEKPRNSPLPKARQAKLRADIAALQASAAEYRASAYGSGRGSEIARVRADLDDTERRWSDLRADMIQALAR